MFILSWMRKLPQSCFFAYHLRNKYVYVMYLIKSQKAVVTTLDFENGTFEKSLLKNY